MSKTFLDEVWEKLPEDERRFMRMMQQKVNEAVPPDRCILQPCVMDPEGKVYRCDSSTLLIWQMVYPELVRVALTKVGKVEVSTVFLPVARKNRHFETMLLDDNPSERKWAYANINAARQGHKEIVAALTHRRKHWLDPERFMAKHVCPQCKHSHHGAASLVDHLTDRHGLRTDEAVREIDKLVGKK